MQLQLYMSAVKGDRIPTGVFYFPASVSYKKPDEEWGITVVGGGLNVGKNAVIGAGKMIREDVKEGENK